MSNPLFLGINEGRTELVNDQVQTMLKDTSVVLVDWEEWRDSQPLYKFGSTVSQFVLPLFGILPNTFLAATINRLWDNLSDIPSVNSYLDSAEYFLYVQEMSKNVPSVIYGHSLGCIPALKLAYDIHAKVGVSISVVLMSPPIGYKPFHKYFVISDPPFTKEIPVIMTFGKFDWLTRVISKLYTTGTNPSNVISKIGDIGHSFTDHAKLLNGAVEAKEFNIGKLFEKIGGERAN
jgi:hypothetical protein